MSKGKKQYNAPDEKRNKGRGGRENTANRADASRKDERRGGRENAANRADAPRNGERRGGRDDDSRTYRFADDLPDNMIIGRNPVMEALKSERRIDKLLVTDGAEGSIKKIVAMAHDKGIIIKKADKATLDRISGHGPHQGVAAYVSEFEYCEPEDILEYARSKGEDPFIIMLDGIEDPHNLGAIIRTADAVGAHGVIIPKRRAAMVTATAEKSAAGATAYVKVARVVNLARTLEELKSDGVWAIATDMDGENYTDASLDGPVVIVIGSEGKGIGRLVKETCDMCVSMPMKGNVNSLNASNAAAVLAYEIVRQRSLKKR